MKLRQRKRRRMARWSAPKELLDRAQRLFGTREEAERWFGSPAMALDSRRPIDLVATKEGAAMVRTLLSQLEYGVYV